MLIAATPLLQQLASGVRAHHERWDGHGYPDGLTGQRIPFAARVVACADAFDAITSRRSYMTRSSPHRAAVEAIETDAGTHFDPQVAAAVRGAYSKLRP